MTEITFDPGKQPKHAGPDGDGGAVLTPEPGSEAGGYDWGDISGEAVERMTKPKIAPVPAGIVAQAQRSVDRDPDNLVNTGIFEKDFGDVAKAETFMKFMKNAGQHTSPRCGMTVRQDPDKEGRKSLIRWQAGKPRGRKPTT